LLEKLRGALGLAAAGLAQPLVPRAGEAGETGAGRQVLLQRADDHVRVVHIAQQ